MKAKNDILLKNPVRQKATKVLIFSHSSQLAGAERSMLELVKELVNDYGIHCIVALPEQGPLVKLLQQEGADTIIAPFYWWCALDEVSYEEVQRRYAQSFNWVIKTLDFFNKLNPDIIITNTLVMPWGAITAFLLKRPHVWMIREFGRINDQGLIFFMPFSDVLKFIKESSDKIITCSYAVQNELFSSVDGGKIETIYNYIQIPSKDVISRYPQNSFFYIPDACHLLIFGSVVKLKGQEDAIRAAIELTVSRNRKVELVIAGYEDAEYKKYLQEIIDAKCAHDYIRIIKFQENIFPLIHQASIILVCTRMEAFARMTQEAMLMGKPVIATNIGGNMEQIIHEETGLLYEPGDFMQLSDQIEKLLDDQYLKRKIARRAYDFAQKTFTKYLYGTRYRNIIMDLKNTTYKNKDAISWFLLHQYQILCDQQNLQIAALYNSTSWRITKPLRFLRGWFKKL